MRDDMCSYCRDSGGEAGEPWAACRRCGLTRADTTPCRVCKEPQTYIRPEAPGQPHRMVCPTCLAGLADALESMVRRWSRPAKDSDHPAVRAAAITENECAREVAAAIAALLPPRNSVGAGE